jgi:hypothetical protein
MHFLIFWGFVVFAIGTASIALEERSFRYNNG